MSVAHVTVRVEEDTPFHSLPYVSSGSGEPVAMLEVGDYQVSVYGPPVALRRLADEAVRAAEDAERLGDVESGLLAVGGDRR